MRKDAARPGQGAGRRTASSVTGRSESTRRCAPNQQYSAPALDLIGLRERLCGARRRLIERLGEDFPPDRRFPDSSWTRMLADIEIAIQAVDAVVDENGA